MNSVTKIIIGLVGIAAIGLITFYVVSKNNEVSIKDTAITNAEDETVVNTQILTDSSLNRIIQELNVDGENFTLSEEEGIYKNDNSDRILIINEDIWSRLIKKVKHQFPQKAKDCDQEFEMPNLTEYKFVGLLTYLAETENSKTTTAYSALEIRQGLARRYAGGNICCECEGEPLKAQKVQAVIKK